MDRNQISNLNMRSENTVVIPSKSYSYGVARGIRVNQLTSANSESLTLSHYLSYFFAEYFKGFVFVILSSVFIFTMPRVLIKGRYAKGMIFELTKRIMDIMGAIVGLIITLPLWLVIPLLIKLDSPGSVFYMQTRVGIDRRKKSRRIYQKVDSDDYSEKRSRERRRENYNGRLFKVYKFRTMVNDAEKNSGPVWATKNDSRITRLGNFLRKTRIDEIPQFLNILKGDMSLVGPRPERPKFVSNLSLKVDDYLERLKVKPGLTGLAQVENGYDSSISSVIRKVKYDLEYIEKKSIWTDIKIIIKTIKVVFTGKGAH